MLAMVTKPNLQLYKENDFLTHYLKCNKSLTSSLKVTQAKLLNNYQANEGERLTSSTHGLKFSSTNISKPYTSENIL